MMFCSCIFKFVYHHILYPFDRGCIDLKLPQVSPPVKHLVCMYVGLLMNLVVIMEGIMYVNEIWNIILLLPVE